LKQPEAKDAGASQAPRLTPPRRAGARARSRRRWWWSTRPCRAPGAPGCPAATCGTRTRCRASRRPARCGPCPALCPGAPRAITRPRLAARCAHACTAQRPRPGRGACAAAEEGGCRSEAAELGRPQKRGARHPSHAKPAPSLLARVPGGGMLRLVEAGEVGEWRRRAERSRVRGGAGGVGGCGGAALPALHQRQHRQPQGRRALHRCAAGAPRRRACVQRPARVAWAPLTSSCDAQPTGARLVEHREALGPRLGLQTARVQPAQPQRGARQRGRHPRRCTLRTAGGLQAGTWSARPPRPSTASTCSRATSTGARPTAAGSLVRDPPASGTLLWRPHHPVRGTAAYVYRQEGRQLKLYGFLLDAGTAALTTAILSSCRGVRVLSLAQCCVVCVGAPKSKLSKSLYHRLCCCAFAR